MYLPSTPIQWVLIRHEPDLIVSGYVWRRCIHAMQFYQCDSNSGETGKILFVRRSVSYTVSFKLNNL